ncbi:hypothetical protein SUNI508_14069 [Seiridium unicorne]|uniref:Uncharacterized protein n=1 Tax=Seiridium unicorne TaxID=138068 RepID=A0ABR2V514_9PEZI
MSNRPPPREHQG